MSVDVMQRLAAANPVSPPEDSHDTPSAHAALQRILSTDPSDGSPRDTRQRHRLGRRRALLVTPAVALTVAIAAVVVLTGGGSQGSSLISNAYAATNSAGVILHYVEIETSTSSNTAPTSVSRAYVRTEVWESGSSWHTFESDTYRQRYGHITSVRSESAEALTATGIALESYIPGGQGGPSPAGHLFKRKYPRTKRAACDIIMSLFRPVVAPGAAGCTPISALRALYRSGGLRAAGQVRQGGRIVDVLKRGDLHGFLPGWQITVFLDPSTFAPLEIRVSSSPGNLDIVRFSDYRRIPLTPSSAKLLTLEPHPGAALTVVHVRDNGLPAG